MSPTEPQPEPPADEARPQPRIVPVGGDALLPYADLDAPRPVPAAPPATARWIAFAGILVGGLLGGLIGWGVADLLATGAVWPAVGALVGGVMGAVGVGVIAGLTLRAMGEWHSVRHPEAG